VFALYRARADDPLTDLQRAKTFLAGWEKLARLLRPALLDTHVDPRHQSLVADRPEFVEECEYLEKDRPVYAQDVREGTRWYVQLPGRVGKFPALSLKNPRSKLFKLWARTDPDAPGAPADKKGYHFLAVLWGENDWWFSTDPVDCYDLSSLAAVLQIAEEKKNPGRVGPDGKDADPWYDGRRHNYTLVRPPKSGTALTAAEVWGVTAKWGQAHRLVEVPSNPVPVPNGYGVRWIARTFAAVAVLCAVAFGVWTLWPSKSPKPIAFTRTVLTAHWRNPSTLQKEAIHSKDFDVPAGGIYEKHVELNLRDESSRPRLVWLQSNKPLPDGIKIQTPDGTVVSAPLGKEKDGIWQTYPLHCPISGGNRSVKVTVPNPENEKRELTLVWRTNPHDIHLHFMAVGVGTYGENSGVAPLASCTIDAKELTNEFQKMQGGLFTEVCITQPLLNERATGDEIKTQLAFFRERVKTDDAPLKLAVIAFSGHGNVYDRREFRFLPTDYDQSRPDSSGIFYADIKRVLGKLPCPTVVIFDACCSGVVVEQIESKQENGPFVPSDTLAGGVVDDDVLGKLIANFPKDSPFFLLTATTGDASGYVNNKSGHGALTQAVLEVLQGKGTRGNNGLFTLDDLWLYAKERVPQIAKQDPDIWFEGRADKIPIAYHPPKK
jgi:hypothetical protein